MKGGEVRERKDRLLSPPPKRRGGREYFALKRLFRLQKAQPGGRNLEKGPDDQPHDRTGREKREDFTHL